MENQSVQYNHIVQRFQSELAPSLLLDISLFKLQEDHKLRSHYKKEILKLLNNNLTERNHVKLLLYIAKELKNNNEMNLAKELFQLVLNHSIIQTIPSSNNSNSNNSNSNSATTELIIIKIESTHGIIQCNYHSITQNFYSNISPMSTSQILQCITQLRETIDSLLNLSTNEQETYAWLILNSIKLIYSYGKSLLFEGCGKYIYESFIYCSLAMDSVINLCTSHHLSLKIKLTSCAFTALLSYGTIDEGKGLLEYMKRIVAELRSREELDPPIPASTEMILNQAEVDIAILSHALSFWKDNDSVILSELKSPHDLQKLSNNNNTTMSAKKQTQSVISQIPYSFPERVLLECLRVQQLTAGNPTESWKKRSTSLLRMFYEYTNPQPTREEQTQQNQTAAPAATTTSTSAAAANKSLSSKASKLSPRAIQQAELLATQQQQQSQQTADKEKELLNSIPTIQLSLRCLVDVLIVAMFDSLSDSASSQHIIHRIQLMTQPEQLQHLQQTSSQAFDPSTLTELQLLQLLITFTSQPSYDNSLLLIESFDSFIHSQQFQSRLFLLRKISLAIWSKIVYPSLQSLLATSHTSLQSTEQINEMKRLTSALLLTIRLMNVSLLDDLVLISCVSLITIQLLNLQGNYRLSLILFSKILVLIDVYRETRVDFQLQSPEDMKDILALQFQSFSVRCNDVKQYFHSIKRLGSHAYAGYGIFGTSSSASQVDNSVVEIQTDLLILYVRTELLYALQLKQTSQSLKSINSTTNKDKQPSSSSDQPTLAAASSTSTSSSSSSPLIGMEHIEQLPIISTLRSTYCKSSYHRSILYLEMSRLELNSQERKHLIEEAIHSLIEAEQREQQLLEQNSSFNLYSSDNAVTPIIASRSHSFCYLFPVISKKVSKEPVEYIRVFGREEGSGVDVSVSSDELTGCDVCLYISNMTSFQSSIVKISNLRYGERYLFACGYYNKQNQLIDTVSLTTSSIEVINPLSTLLLWSYFTQYCSENSYDELITQTSSYVLNYFVHTALPRQVPMNHGKGRVLFLIEQFYLNSLAINQSTSLQLQLFVQTFLISSFRNFQKLSRNNSFFEISWTEMTSLPLNYNQYTASQVSLLTILSKLSLVVTVATHLQHEELITRCLCYGYNLLMVPIQLHLNHLSSYIFSTLSLFITSLLIIPSQEWRDIHHRLYCRFIHLIVHCCVRNGSINSLTTLLSENVNQKMNDTLLSDILIEYNALQFIFQFKHHSFFNSDILNRFKNNREISNSSSSSLELWNLSELDRLKLVRDHVVALLHSVPVPAAPASTAAPSSSDHQLIATLSSQIKQSHPLFASDLITLLVTAIDELSFTDKRQELTAFLQKYPIPKHLLAEKVLEVCSKFHFFFIFERPKSASVSHGAVNVEDNKRPHTPSKDQTLSAIPMIQMNETQHSEPTDEELKRQFKGIATICLKIATTKFEDVSRNDFLTTESGPYEKLSEELLEHGISEEYLQAEAIQMKQDEEKALAAAAAIVEPPPVITPAVQSSAPAKGKGAAAGAGGGGASATATAQHPPASPRPPSLPPFTSVDYIKYLSLSIILFIRGECYQSAVDASIQLWQYILNKWITPVAFSQSFAILRSTFLQLFQSYVQLIESQSSSATSSSSTATGGTGTTGYYHPLQYKQNLYILKDLLIYLVKILTIFKEYQMTVEYSLKMLNLYLMNASEYTPIISTHIIHYLVHCQNQLIQKSQAKIQEREKKLADYIFEFNELQKKKNKKKLRITRTEKTDEEIEFELQTQQLEMKLKQTQTEHENNNEMKENILKLEKRIDSILTTGQQLVNKIIQSKEELLAECRQLVQQEKDQLVSQEGEGGGQSLEDITPNQILFQNKHLLKKFNEINYHFTQIVSFLREKKDRLCLLNTLHEQGDFLLFFDQTDKASDLWKDSIDGIFNSLDAWKEWRGLNHNNDPIIIQSSITIMMVLSKLSRYCSSNNFELKANYCQLAAKVCQFLFLEGLSHPTQLYGFAAYTCYELNGYLSINFNTSSNSIKPFSFQLCCEEIVRILVSHSKELECLPVLVLLEYFHGYYTRRLDKWLEARLQRVRVLIKLHYFAETISMMTSILPTIKSIFKGQYSNPFLSAMNGSQTATEPSATSLENSSEISCNGLDYFNCPPFLNCEPPTSESNKQSVQWLISFPDRWQVESVHYTTLLPPIVKTAEEILKEEQIKAEALAAAAAENAKKGAKKGKEKEEVVEVVPPPSNVAIFTKFHLIEIQTVCCQFLIEITSLDRRTCVEHFKYFQELHQVSFNLLLKSSSLLSSTSSSTPSSSSSITTTTTTGADTLHNSLNDQISKYLPHPYQLTPSIWSNPLWMSLFCRSKLLSIRLLILKRDFTTARTCLLTTIQTISNIKGVFGDSKYELTQFWFELKSLLVEISEYQARYRDGIIVTTQSLKECSTMNAGKWCREFLLERAQLNFKLGNLQESEADCESLLKNCEENTVENDMILVRTHLLLASVLHSYKHTKNYQSVIKLSLDCLNHLQTALQLSKRICQSRGFYTADLNLTFLTDSSDTSMTMKHDQFPPLLHTLTPVYSNYPDIFNTTKNIPTKKLSKKSSSENNNSNNNNNPSDILTPENILSWNNKLRAGPIDLTDNYSKSIFSNIYLNEIRLLSICYSTLCVSLEEFRSASIPAKDLEQYNQNSNEEEKSEENSSSPENLLKQQIIFGEEGLKVLRHTIYPPAIVKISLLLSVGKSRGSEVSKNVFDEKFPDCHEFLEPLTTGLQLCLNDLHQWNLMTSFCLQLVEYYGNQTMSLPIDSKARLKLAVKYLVLATQLSNMNRDIHCSSQSMTADTSIACPEPIESLLLSISSSSIYGSDPKTLPSQMAKRAAENPPIDNTPKGGKSKAPPAKKGTEAAVVASPGKPTLRDAILMLSSLSRESIPFWLDSIEYSLQFDLMNLVKKSFDSIRSKYFLSSLPNSVDELIVPEGSLTSLWIPTSEIPTNRMEQVDYHRACLYPGVIGYLLLGPIKDSSGNFLTPSTEPFLTKVNVTRELIIDHELFYLRLRERLEKVLRNEKKSTETFQDIVNEVKERLTGLFFLLRGIEPTRRDLEVFQLELVEAANQLVVSVTVSGKKVCEMNLMDAETVNSLSLFLSSERASSTMKCEKTVLLFLWAAFKS